SFIITAAQAPIRLIDWPARLRYVWLRSPGDRMALWRMLDRMVREEAIIIAAITAIASLVISLVSDTALWLLLTYMVGCTIAMLLSAYCVMALRLSGASVSEVMLSTIFG